MKIEIKYVSGDYKAGSKILVDVFVKGLDVPTSRMNIIFEFSHTTSSAFKVTGSNSNLFRCVTYSDTKILLENKNLDGEYEAIKLSEVEPIAQAEILVLNSEKENIIRAWGAAILSPEFLHVRFKSNMELLFCPPLSSYSPQTIP